MPLVHRLPWEYWVFSTVLCVPGDTFLFFREPPDGQWGAEHRLGVPAGAGALLLHGQPLLPLRGGSPDVARLLRHAPHHGPRSALRVLEGISCRVAPTIL